MSALIARCALFNVVVVVFLVSVNKNNQILVKNGLTKIIINYHRLKNTKSLRIFLIEYICLNSFSSYFRLHTHSLLSERQNILLTIHREAFVLSQMVLFLILS